MKSRDVHAEEIAKTFASHLGQVMPNWVVRNRPDGAFLLFEFAKPHERLFALLESVVAAIPPSNPYKDRVGIVRRAKRPANVVGLPEANILQKELSESLTVDRYSFGDDFRSRYTPSVTNFEQAIIGNANYIVYGRRGSGKSSLLAYAMHHMDDKYLPFSWIALQTYSGRSDDAAIASVLSDVFDELSRQLVDGAELGAISVQFQKIAEESVRTAASKIQRLIPKARRLIGMHATRQRPLTIFLDDIHVLEESLQPRLLSAIYSLTRGNNCYIKASGIEQFTNIWDGITRQGLEPPHDTQILKLDHNLTMPDRSEEHIVSILDAHAMYCGLPDIKYLADERVLSRLVLVAAAVPRDALGLFSQAITKSLVKGQKAVTITALNAAASEAVEEKLRDISKDTSNEDIESIRSMLDSIRDFCVKQEHLNAFLVKIDNRNNDYQLVQKLIALRFVHVLHEGITPHKAAERYVALMLDYGFYIGVRAATSVRLFPDTPKALLAKDLRKLPIFTLRPKEVRKKRVAAASQVPRRKTSKQA